MQLIHHGLDGREKCYFSFGVFQRGFQNLVRFELAQELLQIVGFRSQTLQKITLADDAFFAEITE